ncbi:MAG: hypothetical protein R6X02_05490 [Enhygromyxa sp.]
MAGSGEGSTEDSGESSTQETGAEESSCEPESIRVLQYSDVCESGCRPLPESCGDAPSCDPACNWDLCETVDCIGEVTDVCGSLAGEVTGWGCSKGFGPCNPWLEECPDGEQCVPHGGALATEWWTLARCAAEQSAKLGEPCSRLEGVFDGIDTCEAGAVCWDVDPDTELGTCIPLCTGAPHAPLCPEGSQCVLADPMWAGFCLPACDPFADNCTPGYTCTLVGDALACMPVASETAELGGTCEHPNDCGSGLACVGADRLPGCAGERCCAIYCDLDAPECSPGELCNPTSSDSKIGLCLPA